MKVAGAEVGHTRLSAFRLPDFMRRARSRWMPVPPPAPSDGIGSGAFRFRGAKLRRARSENAFAWSLRAPASNPALCAGGGSLRRGACHRAGHFRPDPLAPRNAGRRCAARGRRFTRSQRRSVIRAPQSRVDVERSRWLDNLSVGAGDGIRTHDPNLGKVGEFNFSGLPLISIDRFKC